MKGVRRLALCVFGMSDSQKTDFLICPQRLEFDSPARLNVFCPQRLEFDSPACLNNSFLKFHSQNPGFDPPAFLNIFFAFFQYSMNFLISQFLSRSDRLILLRPKGFLSSPVQLLMCFANSLLSLKQNLHFLQ